MCVITTEVFIQAVRSTLLVTYFAFNLDLCVCQPSSHFFHKCQVKQMVFEPTEQNKNKTEFAACLQGEAFVIGFATGKGGIHEFGVGIL